MIFYFAITLLGLLVGSFLNVVIYRLPIMINNADEEKTSTFNLAWPGSHCPQCKHAISPFDNIPIFSFFLRARRCRHCASPISWRYPAIELLTAVVTLIMALHFGWTLQLPFVLVLIWALIALFFIDLDTQLLPDTITLPLIWLGLIANLNGLFTDLESAVIGAVAGYLSLFIVTTLYAWLTKKIGMGQGDFKLLAALGAWLGWQQLPALILISSVLGLMTGVIILRSQKQSFQTPIAFGPYLIFAGSFLLLCKPNLLSLV